MCKCITRSIITHRRVNKNVLKSNLREPIQIPEILESSKLYHIMIVWAYTSPQGPGDL